MGSVASRASVFFGLAVGFGGIVLGGCGASLQPRPLTAAQALRVDRLDPAQRARSLGVVAVEAPREGEAYARILAAQLERTHLFLGVVLVPPDGTVPSEVDTLATVTGRCSERQGGWIPWITVLTLGIVPQFHTFEVGLPFTLKNLETGREVAVPCEIRSTLGVGWIPALFSFLPGWSQEESERTPAFARRLAYAIVSRTAPPP